MNQQAEDAITAMLNCFPQTSQNYDLLLTTFAALLREVSDQAIIETARRFASGDIADQSKKFAPSAPEFVEAARRQQELIDIRSRWRLPAPRGPVSTRLSPFEIKRQQAFERFAGRPVLFEDVSLEMFTKLSKERAIPPGAQWCGILGTIYGPAPKQQSAAA